MAINLKAITSCMGYQQISTLSSAQSLTIPEVDPSTGLKAMPTIALITPETNGVRWRDDGTAPTATVGYLLTAGSELEYEGPLDRLRFIETASSAKLNICYYG